MLNGIKKESIIAKKMKQSKDFFINHLQFLGLLHRSSFTPRQDGIPTNPALCPIVSPPTAFTLAEILITLGIIGVVASITIPALIANLQDRQWKEAAKAAYSKASQVVTQMKQDYGTLADFYTSGNSFKPVFAKYFRVVRDCNLNDCVPGSTTSNIYNNLYGTPGVTWFMYYGQFTTLDGMFWGIYNPGSGSDSLIMITVDVNGYGTKPNVFGKDVFMFQLINDYLVPMGISGSYLAPSTYCARGTNTGWEGLACMTYVIQGREY